MQERKFTEVYEIDDYEILTDSGWQDVVRIGKTVEYRVWEISTGKRSLLCADDHILFNEKVEEVFAKDLKVGNFVMTESGIEEITVARDLGYDVEMYDLEVDHEDHRYYTNGFLSHNTLWICHIATSLLMSGHNVLYVSAEMSEEMIGKRMDANLLDYTMDNLDIKLDKKEYFNKVKELYGKTTGRMKIVEYSPGACNALTLRNLLQEYKLKDSFVPDVVILDYLNLFGSFRLPSHAMQNSYLWVKSVAEEFRGLARELNFSCIAPTQTNRSGVDAGQDTDMGDTAESFGLPMTADWMGAIIQNDELFRLCKYLLKTLKTRFGENINEVLTVGVNRSHMRLYDLPEDQQELPLHVKDMLKQQAEEIKLKKDKEASEDLSMNFKFS